MLYWCSNISLAHYRAAVITWTSLTHMTSMNSLQYEKQHETDVKNIPIKKKKSQTEICSHKSPFSYSLIHLQMLSWLIYLLHTLRIILWCFYFFPPYRKCIKRQVELDFTLQNSEVWSFHAVSLEVHLHYIWCCKEQVLF